MTKSSDEIISEIKLKMGMDSSPILNLNSPTVLDNIGKSQPINLTNYNIGGSDDFSVDRSGRINANFKNYLEDYGNEDRLAQQQTWLDDLGNGVVKFLGKTGLNVMDGVSSFTYGIYNGIKEGSLDAVFDNDVNNWFDEQSRRLDRNFATYYTDEEKSQNALGKLLTFSYFVDGVSNGASFIAGALLPEVALAIVTGGASAPASFSRFGAKLGLKSLAKSTDNIATNIIEDVTTNSVKQANKNITRETGAKAIRDLNRYTSIGKWTGETVKTAGFLTRSSMFEAGMEARHNLHDSVDNYIQEYQSKYGTLPSRDELSVFMEDAGKQANGVFWGNMAILSISNVSMFGKMIDLKPLRSIGLTNVGQNASKTWDKIIGLSVDTLEDGTKILSKGNKLQKIIGTTAPAFRKIATEGIFEEGGQGILGKTMQEYLNGKYINNDATMTYFDALKKGISEQFTTSEGGFEILMGGVIGLVGGNVSALVGKSANAIGVKGFEGASFGLPGMFQEGYNSKRNTLLTSVQNYNEHLKAFRTSNRLNSLTAYSRENTAQSDVFEDTVSNYNFIKTSENFKDVSDTIEDYNHAIDLMSFDPEDLKNQGIDSSQVESYKESLKNKFSQDYNSYEKSKRIVDRLEFNNTGLSQGNLTELKDALTFSLMSADVAGNRATNIAEQIVNLTNGNTDVNVIKFFETLDNKNKVLAKEYSEKELERNNLTQTLAEIGANIEASKDSEKRMKELSKQRQAALKRMLQLDKEIVKIENSLKEELSASSFEGMKNSAPTIESVRTVVENYKSLNDYIEVLDKAGKRSEANDIRFLLDQYKKYNAVYLDCQNTISRMMTTNFFNKNKSFTQKIIGDKYKASDKLREVLSEREVAISNILSDFGYDSFNAPEDLIQMLEQGGNLSDREKYQIESIIRTIAMQNRVQDILEQAETSNFFDPSDEISSSNYLTGDEIVFTNIPENLDNIEQLNNLIKQISEQIDQVTNTPTREALKEIKDKREELALLEQQLLDLQNGNLLPISILQPINTDTDALQKQISNEIFQREQEEVGETRSERGQMEQSLEGQETTSQKEEVISDEEYQRFIDEGIVDEDTISDIANNIREGIELTERENSIFTDKTSEINAVLEEYFNNDIQTVDNANEEDLVDIVNNLGQYEITFPNEQEEQIRIEGDNSEQTVGEDANNVPGQSTDNESRTTIQSSVADSENSSRQTEEDLRGGYDREESRLTQDIDRIRQEISDLETPFKFLESEGYKRYLSLLEQKVNDPENVNEGELLSLEKDMDNWFAILGTGVNDDFHLSDLVKQMVALENMDVTNLPDTEEISEDDISQDIKFADKVQDNFFAVGINTAVAVGKLVDIEGVKYMNVSNVSIDDFKNRIGIDLSDNMYEVLPDTKTIRLTLQAVEDINKKGDVRILVPDFDSTLTNYESLKIRVFDTQGNELYETYKTDFTDAVNDIKAYEVEEGSSLRLSVDRENDFNENIFSEFERILDIVPTQEREEEIRKKTQLKLTNNSKYQTKVNELRALKLLKNLSTTDKNKVKKLENEIALIENDTYNKVEDALVKKALRGEGRIPDDLRNRIVNELRIDLVDSENTNVQTLKGMRVNQSKKVEASKSELQSLRTMIANNDEMLITLAEMGRGTGSKFLISDLNVKVSEVFPGLPNNYMSASEDGSMRRIYKPIQVNQIRNIIDTGYIANGKVVLKNGTENIKDSFIRSAKNSLSSTKKPIIVIKQGSQNIAYPIRVLSDTIEVDLNEFQAIYNNPDISPTEKAIRLNGILANSGIDVTMEGNSFIVIGNTLDNEVYNNLFARLQNISYLRDVSPLTDKNISILEGLLSVGASTSLDLSNPFSGAKFKLDLSEFKPLEVTKNDVTNKVVDAHVNFENDTNLAGIRRIKKQEC